MSPTDSLPEVGPTPVSFFYSSPPRRVTPQGARSLLESKGDHVDILGRSSLNDLILRVAGGKGDLIDENFVSDIREYAEKVRIFEEDEFTRDRKLTSSSSSSSPSSSSASPAETASPSLDGL